MPWAQLVAKALLKGGWGDSPSGAKGRSPSLPTARGGDERSRGTRRGLILHCFGVYRQTEPVSFVTRALIYYYSCLPELLIFYQMLLDTGNIIHIDLIALVNISTDLFIGCEGLILDKMLLNA